VGDVMIIIKSETPTRVVKSLEVVFPPVTTSAQSLHNTDGEFILNTDDTNLENTA